MCVCVGVSRSWVVLQILFQHKSSSSILIIRKGRASGKHSTLSPKLGMFPLILTVLNRDKTRGSLGRGGFMGG